MAWITTKDGKHVNTDWFDEDERKKYADIEKQQEQAKKASDIESSKNKKDNTVVLENVAKKEGTMGQDALDNLKEYMEYKGISLNDILEKDEDGYKFKASVTDKQTGQKKLMEISGRSIAACKDDFRRNGYSVSRIFPKNIYAWLINATNMDNFDLRIAKQFTDALMKGIK